MQKTEKISVLAGVLLVVTAVVAFLLAGVNHMTAPVIAQNMEAEQTATRRAVLRDAAEFVDLAYQPNGEGDLVTAVFEGKSGGQTVGYCISVQPAGYGGPIDMVVGIHAQGQVEAVQIISMSETAGLGAKAGEEDFLSQFADTASGPLSVIKNGAKKENEIVAITGATVTSKAVTEGVNAALAAAKALQEVETE